MSTKLPKGVSGPEGVIAAVIKLAYQDAMKGNARNKADALRYLRSELHQADLQALGYPKTTRPNID